ncbi:type II secretion system minor pseudopilin GspJ [Sphingomicrobium flavum]|uniref:type II secretion system minor pseudopilin GspJ n=1 Tax=Sphingomicrobium flavum TaxID=1229164 RepID=UPI0021AD7BE4|nr:type II secretion system minor pseudopilin GspJ [Sphingomicrobium flavum]
MRNGFTLIEMMVALAIFAMLSAGGVLLLRGSADTQSAVERQLSSLSSMERVRLLLAADLSQALARPTRAGDGSNRPAFTGDASAMRFVRGGFEALSDEPEPDLARIRWSQEAGRIVRRQYGRLDGGDDPALDAELLENVEGLALAYRDASGGWVNAWPDGSGLALPRAVRVTLTRAATPIEMIFAIPSAGQEPQQLDADAPAEGPRI